MKQKRFSTNENTKADEKADEKTSEKMDEKIKSNDFISVATVLKKIVSGGLGAAARTEDAVKEIREALNEIFPPKELVNLVFQNLRHSKEEIIHSLASGVEEHLKKLNLTNEIQKEIKNVLDNYDLEIHGHIRFKKRNENNDNNDNNEQSSN